MRRACAIWLCLALAGCATTYQPQSLTGGFDEVQLDTNVFRVTFKGNGFTSSERAEDLALLRSADLALKHGFTHFVIVEGKSRAELGVATMPTQSTTTGTVNFQGNTAYGQANTVTSGGQAFLIRRPSSTNTILCFQGKPDIGGMVYDARFVFGSLGKKYGVSESK